MEPLTLTELMTAVADRWRVLLVGAVVGTGLAGLVHAVLPTRFEAVSVVHVEAADPSRVDMTAEESAATSRRVVREARDAWGPGAPTLDELQGAATATAVADSAVLHIRYVADTPHAAARGADAVANAYLATRAVDASRRAERLDDRLSRQMRGLDRRARAAVAAERARMSVLDEESGAVVDGARPPDAPAGPGLPATALGGLVLGLLVATPVAARPIRAVRPTRTPGAPAS